MRLTALQASAVRRAALVASVLAATLGAHAASARDLAIEPTAPFLWGAVVLAAVMAGAPRAPWRPRSAGATLLRLVVGQAACHAVLGAVPWAFGLTVHHRMALITPAAIWAHLAAALVLTVLLTRLDHVLSAATRALRRLRPALRAPRLWSPRAAAPRPAPAHHPLPLRASAAPVCRGPPADRACEYLTHADPRGSP